MAILHVLQADSQKPLREISEIVGLSQTPCYERVKKLERDGLIKGYHAHINLEQCAALVRAYVSIRLDRHEQQDFEKFEAAVRKIPEVIECYALGGEIDYRLTVVVCNRDALQSLVDRLMEQNVGIAFQEMHSVKKSVKRYTVPAVSHL